MTPTATAPGRTLLFAKQPRRVAAAASEIAAEALAQIDAALPGALDGRRPEVRLYVRAYRKLTERVIDSIRESRPDLAFVDEENQTTFVVELKRVSRGGASRNWLKAALEQEAMSAPFSDWVGTFGAGDGTAIALVNHLRLLLQEGEPLAHLRKRTLPDWAVDDRDAVNFYRLVLDEIQKDHTPLRRLASVLGLNKTQLADLFGIKRQALDHWLAIGVPDDRYKKVATLGEIADLLLAKTKADRIPAIVRRPAPAYGNRTILEAVGAGDEDAVLMELRRAFDWATPA